MVCQFCSWSAERVEITVIISCPCSRPRIRSRETGSADAFRISSPILLTQAAKSGAYSWTPLTPLSFHDRVYLYSQPPPGQSRVYQITHLRIGGVLEQPGMIANPARGHLNREPCPRSRLRTWFRECVRPSRPVLRQSAHSPHSS